MLLCSNVFLSIGLLFFMFPENLQESKLRVIIYGYEKKEGVLRVALFNSADHFLVKPYRAMTVRAACDSAEVVFDNLPAGRYAVGVFLDENGNKILDKNLVGWPKEAYGFSNNAQGIFGPPAFYEADFGIIETNHLIRIKLK